MDLVAGCQGTADFPGTDRIDHHIVLANEFQNRQVRAGLLGVPNNVKRGEILDSLNDGSGVVHVGRRTELGSQLLNGNAGDFLTRGRECGDLWHSEHQNVKGRES